MARLARLDAPGVLHHIIGRGIERAKILLSKIDRNDFIARVRHLAEDGSMAVYAWALLQNHFNLLCKTKKRPLSLEYAQAIDSGYVVNFNKRHLRHGHLLHNRYKSIVCQEDAYVLGLVRYIHLHPVKY